MKPDNENASPVTEVPKGQGLTASLCSRFFELPIVRCLRAHRYMDACHDLGADLVNQCLEKGYVVVPWAEHADMFLAWEGCGEDFRKLYESSLGPESISRLNVAAQMLHYVEGRPIPGVQYSEQPPTDMPMDDQDTRQKRVCDQPEDKNHLSGAVSQIPQPNCETDL